jgi:hypothetical protein
VECDSWMGWAIRRMDGWLENTGGENGMYIVSPFRLSRRTDVLPALLSAERNEIHL